MVRIPRTEPDAPTRRPMAMGLGMLLVFAAFWYVYSGRYGGSADPTIPDMSPEEFVEAIGDGKPAILEFYISSCPWCSRVEAELETIKKEKGRSIFIARLNAEKYPAEAKLFGISGFPTLMFFDETGTPVLKAGGYRPAEDIIGILTELGFIH